MAIGTADGTLGTFRQGKRGYRHGGWDVGHVQAGKAWLSAQQMGRWARSGGESVAIGTADGTLDTRRMGKRGYRHSRWDVGHTQAGKAWLSAHRMGRWRRAGWESVAIGTADGTLGTFRQGKRGY